MIEKYDRNFIKKNSNEDEDLSYLHEQLIEEK